jgi:glycosyltransferase involved in cell wall biosynthesis
LLLTRNWIDEYSTIGLAASKQAAAALFPADWETDNRWRVAYYGIDLVPFQQSACESAKARKALSVPGSARIIGHVGRFVEAKNHYYLMEIISEVVQRAPNTHLLLVGEGPLRKRIEQRAIELGIANHVTFAGLQSNVPDLMLGAIDVMVLPSLYEGLPVVALEAQAAGLPIIASDSITSEFAAVPDLVRQISLSYSPMVWAEAILAVLNDNHREENHKQALRMMEQSPFNIKRSVRALEDFYLGNV